MTGPQAHPKNEFIHFTDTVRARERRAYNQAAVVSGLVVVLIGTGFALAMRQVNPAPGHTPLSVFVGILLGLMLTAATLPIARWAARRWRTAYVNAIANPNGHLIRPRGIGEATGIAGAVCALLVLVGSISLCYGAAVLFAT